MTSISLGKGVTEVPPIWCMESRGGQFVGRVGSMASDYAPRYLELGAGKPLIHFSVFNQVFQFFDFKSDFL